MVIIILGMGVKARDLPPAHHLKLHGAWRRLLGRSPLALRAYQLVLPPSRNPPEACAEYMKSKLSAPSPLLLERLHKDHHQLPRRPLVSRQAGHYYPHCLE